MYDNWACHVARHYRSGIGDIGLVDCAPACSSRMAGDVPVWAAARRRHSCRAAGAIAMTPLALVVVVVVCLLAVLIIGVLSA